MSIEYCPDSLTPAKPDIDSPQDQIPDYIVDTMARVLLPALRAFYDSTEGQTAFEEWKQRQKQERT